MSRDTLVNSLLQKQRIPFLFLIFICLFWSWFYLTNNALNEQGAIKPEWLLLLDGLVVLPLLCFVFIPNAKQALIKALVYGGLIVVLGSQIIPLQEKLIWPYFEAGRYLLIAAFVAFELTVIATVILAIKVSLRSLEDPDIRLRELTEKRVESSQLQALLCLEARVWTYFLFAKKAAEARFYGESHFYGHNKDGTQSNLLGFIFVILLEMPIMHLLLHFLVSAMVANLVTLLSILGLVFFIAEYRAIGIRPVSITNTSIIVRYGVWQPLELKLSEVVAIEANDNRIKRGKGIKRYNLSGVPNVRICLLGGDNIYLGLDTPQHFITAVNQKLTSLQSEK